MPGGRLRDREADITGYPLPTFGKWTIAERSDCLAKSLPGTEPATPSSQTHDGTSGLGRAYRETAPIVRRGRGFFIWTVPYDPKALRYCHWQSIWWSKIRRPEQSCSKPNHYRRNAGSRPMSRRIFGPTARCRDPLKIRAANQLFHAYQIENLVQTTRMRGGRVRVVEAAPRVRG
jgi:hypothetical protein